MISKAVLRYIRISPRKVRQVIPLVKGKDPEQAVAILYSVKKKASQYLIDLLRSAMANAKRMQGVDITNLYISKLVADGGPQMKRFRAASMGRAGMIRKRTSHITLELDSLPVATSEAHGHTKAGAKEPAQHEKVKSVKTKSAHSAAKKTKTKEPVKHDSGKKGKE